MQKTTKNKPRSPKVAKRPGLNGSPPEVLTLAEAAAYLRLDQPDVLALINEQGLPARRIKNEWRFSRAAIQQWLSTPVCSAAGQGIWATAGTMKDDPYLDQMLEEIDRMRGRPANMED